MNGVLSKAADLVEDRGLAKGRIRNQAGQYCVLGAIGQAVRAEFDGELGSLPAAMDLYNASTKAVENHLGFGLLSVWNDEAQRTETDVVRVLRQAADQHTGTV